MLTLYTAATPNGFKVSAALDGLDLLRRWNATVAARPAAQRGVRVPDDVSERMKNVQGDAARRFSEAARTMVEMGNMKS